MSCWGLALQLKVLKDVGAIVQLLTPSLLALKVLSVLGATGCFPRSVSAWALEGRLDLYMLKYLWGRVAATLGWQSSKSAWCRACLSLVLQAPPSLVMLASQGRLVITSAFFGIKTLCTSFPWINVLWEALSAKKPMQIPAHKGQTKPFISFGTWRAIPPVTFAFMGSVAKRKASISSVVLGICICIVFSQH